MIALVLALATVAQAQDSARALADRARVAAEEGRLAEARTLLEDALEREPSAAFAFNLALVLEPMGELLDADALLGRLLAGDFGVLDAERRERVEQFRAEIRANIATVEIRTRGRDAEVRVDGVLRGRTQGRRLSIEIDPGERHVELTAGNDRVGRTLAIRPAETRAVEFAIGAVSEDPVEIPDEPLDDGDTVWESPWLWTIVAVLALGGAGVAVGFALSGDALPGNFLGESEALY